MLITLDSFCTLIRKNIMVSFSLLKTVSHLLSRMIPCLMHVWYCTILLSGLLGHHSLPNLIYLGMKSTTGNEPDTEVFRQQHHRHLLLPAQLGVHVLLGHFKSISHVSQCQATKTRATKNTTFRLFSFITIIPVHGP